MRVLVLSNLYPPDVIGGYELGCRQAVDALLERGHEVRVLTTAHRSPTAEPPHVQRDLRLTDMWDFYSDSQSRPVTLHLRDAEGLQVSSHNLHALIRHINEFQPDVAYVWMLVGVGGLGMMACLHHLNVPWVWHLMDEVPSKLCALFYRVQPELAHEVSRQLRGVYLSCSRQLVDDIERQGLDLSRDVRYLPNWVSGPRSPRMAGKLRSGTLRIAAAAAVIDRHYDKGIDLLIRAASMLRDAGHTDFCLDIFGRVTDGHYEEQIRSLELGALVRLKGPLAQEALLEALEGYDVFAFPGRTGEPFGFAPLEALSRGCVPIINRCCGIGEWLVDGVHCLKASRDARSFATAIERVLEGETPIEDIARRGHEVVWRDFHLDALLPTIERELQRAAGMRRPTSGSASEAYRLALLAEKLCGILIQDACSA